MSERDQFEAWWSSYADVKMITIKSKRASRGGYFDEFIDRAWHAWQASREALKAEQEGVGEHWYLVSYSEQGGRVGSIEIGVPRKWSKGDAQEVTKKLKQINKSPGEVIIVSICEIDGTPSSQPPPIDTTSQQYEALAKGE